MFLPTQSGLDRSWIILVNNEITDREYTRRFDFDFARARSWYKRQERLLTHDSRSAITSGNRVPFYYLCFQFSVHLSLVCYLIYLFRAYILRMHLYPPEFSPARANLRYNVIFFPNTWIRLFIYRFVDALTRVHFSHFRKIRSFFFPPISHSFTHVIAFLLVARPHTWDIRRVLIMLLDRWPLSSPFHEIPARGGITYYVPGPSVPSHTVFHGDRLHWDHLNVVALKCGDSGVNFSARIKGVLKLCGLNFVVPCSVCAVCANCVSIHDRSDEFDTCSDRPRLTRWFLYFNDLSCQIEIICKLKHLSPPIISMIFWDYKEKKEWCELKYWISNSLKR